MASLSKRGVQNNSFVNELDDAFARQCADRYHRETNPEGIINVGTSQNKLMFDLLSEKFAKKSSQVILEEYTHYFNYLGLQSFRKEVAKFLNYYMKPVDSINPENLVALNGCGPIIEALGQMLADPGDGFLVPSPFYGGYKTSLMLRLGVVPFPVPLSGEPGPGETQPFELTVERLEKAWNDAKQQGVKIRALLLCNPNNPLGNIYPEKLVQDCLQFAHKYGIHVVMDEIYMLSVFQKDCSMKSVLGLTNIPDPERLHVVWGFSKDFAVSGFRCGVLHTLNKDLIAAINKISYFQCVPPVMQHILMNLIKDLDWLDKVFIPTNHKRLLKSYSIVSEALQNNNVSFLETKAGFFIWADFRKFLKEPTFQEEWRLFELFMANKVYITPGVVFTCSEPGWFRIIFTVDPKMLEIAIGRLLLVVNEC